jgi:trimethylamine:corrinoid methyltransferase-like protein
MRPSLQLLETSLVERILSEAFELIRQRGVKVQAPEAAELLAAAGVGVENGIAHIPESLARKAIGSVPRKFSLHNRAGEPVVNYGGEEVHFDPGSSCVQVLDAETLEHRMSKAVDLVRLVQVAETLPQYAAQSTAVVCTEVPNEIGDLYRLFLVLWYSNKPIITGAFSPHTAPVMIDLLAADCGGRAALKEKPRAVFDVCPSPPLHWTEFAAQNMVDLARAWVPAQIVSMPLAGAAAPVTLSGAVVQHAAECISGITIHQLAQPGAPVVWGGAPAIFDMRSGITPMGAVETTMLNLSCAQIGKHLGLPTHGYLLGSDAKLVDAQAGQESGIAAVMGALGGINMISGAGMLDSLACHSSEKLALDAETIAMAQRVLQGVQVRTETLALDMFAKAGAQGDFLKIPETRKLFRLEQHLPSKVIDRGSLHSWEQTGKMDAFGRAKERVKELLSGYKRPEMSERVEESLRAIVREQASRVGMDDLPGIG